ncbi:PREDICTED: mitochondrial inner membrane protein OXA1-like [Tarenaya hassleriana]|nr:PREDICTED: mitochondrial inner membrane protein OXA1-like [Tarenaya hassleriana]XP_010544815.1 PREDICTED: mitochondrial inner membrane protein OXA1-like [Tarenaya hassleriana]
MIQTDLVKFKREWLLIFDDLKPGLSLLIATAADWFIYISTFLAIRNMAQKMPSFESGGILWFTDLTTPDSFYVLPAVLGVTFWFTTMSDDSYQRQQKPGFEAFSLLCWIFTTVAFQAIFSIESAVFCFMISSNIIGYGLDMATKSPKVRKLLKIRNLPDGSPDGVTLSEVLEISQRIQSASKAPNATKKELLKNAERIQSPKKIRNAAKKKGKNKKR